VSKEEAVVLLGFVVAVVLLAVLAQRFGFDSRAEVWSAELREDLDWAA
jgi:hypothetical protein